MGEFRDYRLTIPGAVLLITIIITLWLAAGWSRGPFHFFPWIPVDLKTGAGLLAALVSLIVPGFAGGFVCSAFLVLLMNIPGLEKLLWRNLRSLEKNLGLPKPNSTASDRKCLAQWWKRRIERRKELRCAKAEFHLRLHCHAPKELLDFATRRLTAMYASWSSVIAIALALLISKLIMIPCGARFPWGVLIGSALPVVVFVWNGYTAMRDFWDVMWKWCDWDRFTHPTVLVQRPAFPQPG